MSTGPIKLNGAIFAYNGDLFMQLAELVDDCSYSQEYGCLQCPHLLKCRKWWDTSVCEHTTGYRANLRSYDTFVERFDKIRTGQYKGGNGHNGQQQ